MRKSTEMLLIFAAALAAYAPDCIWRFPSALPLLGNHE
jgi:hypothetical protein